MQQSLSLHDVMKSNDLLIGMMRSKYLSDCVVLAFVADSVAGACVTPTLFLVDINTRRPPPRYPGPG